MIDLPEFKADDVAIKTALEILLTADPLAVEKVVITFGLEREEALHALATAIRDALDLGDFT